MNSNIRCVPKVAPVGGTQREFSFGYHTVWLDGEKHHERVPRTNGNM